MKRSVRLVRAPKNNTLNTSRGMIIVVGALVILDLEVIMTIVLNVK